MLVFLYNSTKGKTMRLYIIGNGFDMRHGLPTGYKHFKSYVEKNDQDLYDAIEEYIPAGDEWNELENALGEIDYELILQNSEIFLASYNTDDWSDAYHHDGNDSNLLIVFYVQIMPDDFVMQLHRF
ncbi:AbiH family protein [Escherichia coli]|uniref:AbiH family protein n=2 Tax=Escherichia coli TaxID=562 RepID=UPI00201AE4A0|nr:AbiH family protein [Escherichia coli]